jgi:surfeit locus 1 family protein
MIAPLLFGLLGVALRVARGVWPLTRHARTEGSLAEIEARLAAAPVEIPQDPDPARDRYLRVRATGEIEPGELHVFTAAPGGGAGYRIVVPLHLADGRRILLDRGIVPDTAKDAPRRLGPIAVEGSLAWPDETDRFTSAPDREKNIWYARDAGLMAEALGTLPVTLVTATSDDPEAPVPMPVTVNIPNNHLQYAVTWFGLAVVWALMTVYLLWRIKRRID